MKTLAGTSLGRAANAETNGLRFPLPRVPLPAERAATAATVYGLTRTRGFCPGGVSIRRLRWTLMSEVGGYTRVW